MPAGAVFDDMITDMTSSRRLHHFITINISMVMITQSYFSVPNKYYTFLYHEDSKKSEKYSKLSLIIYLILTPNTLWSYTENVQLNLFLVIGNTLPLDHSLSFRNNLLK